MKQQCAAARQRASPAGSSSSLTPQRSSTSAAPTRPLTARLPCLATGTPAAAATGAAAVPAGAGGIEHVAAVELERTRPPAHRARAAGQLGSRLALDFKRDQEA